MNIQIKHNNFKMGWKERPPCVICGKPALIFMMDRYFCGPCVAEWDKKQKEIMFNRMKEGLK